MTWAFEQQVFSSPQKFVLVALANFANEENYAYPSVATICGITMQKDETVRSALVALAEQGFIEDTGKRYGHTQQVKVWKLNLKTPEMGGLKDTPKDSPKTPPKLPPKTPEKGEQSLEPINHELGTGEEKNSPPKSNSEAEAKPTPVPPPPSQDSHAELVAYLKANYTWVDVDAEIVKMREWLSRPVNKHRHFTRKFAIRWINKIERPIAFSEPPKEEAKWHGVYTVTKGPRREHYPHLSDDDFKDIMRGWTEWREKNS